METTHQSVSTIEMEEAAWRHSSVVGRKDKGRRAARQSEECRVGGVIVDRAAAARTRRVKSMVWSCFWSGLVKRAQ
jgi:hypothetical protein